jgi:hypothetical protein
VDRTGIARVVGDIRILQMQIAERAFDDQAVVADGIAMGPARDEAYVVARGRHPCAEIPADCPRRHRCNSHEKSARFATGRIIQIWTMKSSQLIEEVRGFS